MSISYLSRLNSIRQIQTNIFIGVICGIYLCLIGCDNRISSTLDSIEQIIEFQPDSAWILLNSIPRDKLTDSDDYANFCLSYTQAQIKKNIEVDHDSLISVAYYHFYHKNDEKRYMLACIYFAFVNYYAGNYGAALAAGLDAEEIALSHNDYRNLARTSSLLSLIYSATFNHQKALEYQLQDYEASIHTNDIEWIQQSYLGLIDCYLACRKLKDAEEAIKKVDMDSLYDRNAVLDCKIKLLSLCNKDQELYELYRSGMITLDAVSVSAQSCIAIALSNVGYKNEGNNLIRDLELEATTHNDSVDILCAKWLMALNSSDYEQAYQYLEIINHHTNNTLTAVSANSIHLYQVEHEKNKVQQIIAQNHRKTSRFRIIIFGCILLLLGFLYIGISMHKLHQFRQREKEYQLQALTEEYNRLKDELQSSRKDEIHLFIKSFDWIERIGDIYADSTISTKAKTSVYNKVEKTIAEIKSPKFLQELERLVNRYRNDLLFRIKSTCPSLNSTEITLLTYLCTGISTRVLEIILNKNGGAIYSLKYRIRIKIKAANESLLNEMSDIFHI